MAETQLKFDPDRFKQLVDEFEQIINSGGERYDRIRSEIIAQLKVLREKAGNHFWFARISSDGLDRWADNESRMRGLKNVLSYVLLLHELLDGHTNILEFSAGTFTYMNGDGFKFSEMKYLLNVQRCDFFQLPDEALSYLIMARRSRDKKSQVHSR